MSVFAAFATGFCQKTAFLSAKAQKLKNSAKQNSWTVCRFSLWNVFPPLKPAFFSPNSAPLNSGLWLGAFGKVWLFRCQSGIRGLWLEAFDKSGFFRCQSRSSRLSRQAHGGILLVSTLLEICILNRENLCVTEFILLLPPPQDVSTHYRSVDMTAFAAFATGFCQKNSVFLCKGTKLKTVCRFSLWTVFPPLKPAFFFPNSA